MVLMAIFTTFITTPLVMALYKTSETTQTQDSDSYKNCKRRRKIESEKEEEQTQQLKVLICLQSGKDINPMVKLIEASHGRNQNKETFCVYVMHLTQLSKRPSSIRMVQKARRNGLPFWNKKRDNVLVAFEASCNVRNVSVRSVTAISPLVTVHEDICSSADSKHAAFVILPFHRQWSSLEQEFETVRSEFQGINKRVLENSPCSVGILVDRGGLSDNDSEVASRSFSLSVNVLFFGGGDDREALAYGLRMAEHPGIKLTIVAISGSDISKSYILEAQETPPFLLDERFLVAIRNKAAISTRFEERIVNSTYEAVKIIQEFCKCDILLVGKSSERPFVSKLPVMMKMDYPELGPVGNLILISTSVSVLVVQQYTTRNPSVVGSVSVAVVETP